MKKVLLNLGPRSYEIVITSDGFGALAGALKKLNIGSDAIVLTNPRVRKLYGAAVEGTLKRSGYSVNFFTVADSERSKSWKTASSVLERIAKYDVRRQPFLVALGGGVIGDLGGFVASVYKRGIPYVGVPTTLLAQVDASIGGKTALDLSSGKNLVGTFYQPRLVFANLAALGSLSQRAFRCGLAEVVKCAVIADRNLFEYLQGQAPRILKGDGRALEHIVFRCAQIKAAIVSQDERETRMERTLLNFGHTIGHALEAACGYSGAYSHGEAVSIGMVGTARLALELAILDKEQFQQIEGLLRALGLPTKIKKKISASSIIAAQGHDKKNIRGQNRFVLPIEIGHVGVFEGVPQAAVVSAIKGLRSI